MLADLSLGDGNAMELMRVVRGRALEARIVIITAFSDTFAAVEALVGGASGYVLKSQSSVELLAAIRTVAAGQSYLSPEVAARLPGPATGGTSPRGKSRVGLEALSRREREIFRQAVEGYATGEIARRLRISSKTVEAHRTRINRKLAVRTTADLVRFAVAHGIVAAHTAPAARGD